MTIAPLFQLVGLWSTSQDLQQYSFDILFLIQSLELPDWAHISSTTHHHGQMASHHG
jgi:hypothetical protein